MFKGKLALAAALCAASLSVSSAWADGWDDLRAAIYYNQEAEVARLLDGGADVNMRNAEGWTPLHIAAEQGQVRMVRYLLARGADPNAKTERGRTPYDVAAGYNEVQAILKGQMAAPEDPFAAYLGKDGPKKAPAAKAPAKPAAKPALAAKAAPAQSKKANPNEAHCKKMWHEATALCGLGATSCNTSAHIRYQACLKKGTWY